MIKPTRSIAQFALFAVLASGGAAVVSGQSIPLVVDPAQTKVEFTLGDILHTVRGEFRLKRGDLHFDPQTGAAGGELIVDAASGTSGSDARDSRMRKNILESDRYPDIVFRPDRVDGKVVPEGHSHVQLHGIFSIHGSGHELSMPVEVESSGGQYTTTATFVVPYVKWGMKNPSTLFLRVSQQVEITIHTVAKAR